MREEDIKQAIECLDVESERYGNITSSHESGEDQSVKAEVTIH